ncbi:DUF4276 family protein [Desulfoplanes sp.]
MIRLNIIVEGQTEERFVNQLLKPHLAERGVYAFPRVVLMSHDKKTNTKYKGGLKTYTKARNDIVSWLRQDSASECRFTTMFDFYALPDDFPLYDGIKKIKDPYCKIDFLEKAFAEDIQDERFIPYLQLHEFEALLFSDPVMFDWEYLEHDDQIARLCAIAQEFINPELINNNPSTAPFKRILHEIPEYDKVGSGSTIAGAIGLDAIRKKCRHFDAWVTELENL